MFSMIIYRTIDIDLLCENNFILLKVTPFNFKGKTKTSSTKLLFVTAT